jgi:hypothetical protein
MNKLNKPFSSFHDSYSETISAAYGLALAASGADIATSLYQIIVSYLSPNKIWLAKEIIGYDKSNALCYFRRIGPSHRDVLCIKATAPDGTIGWEHLVISDLDRLDKLEFGHVKAAVGYLEHKLQKYAQVPIEKLVCQINEDAHLTLNARQCVCPSAPCPVKDFDPPRPGMDKYGRECPGSSYKKAHPGYCSNFRCAELLPCRVHGY